MVLITAVRDYINRMLHDISGMKVLILDSHTVSIVSVVYSQSELLQKEVFLVELVDSISMSKEPMSHLKAVYFLRPTSQNIHLLRRQLTTPRFGEYHLFFSNMLKDTQLHNIADSDEHEIVQQVQEFYADFVAIDAYHFTFNIASNHMYMLPAVVDPSSLQQFCDRVIDGIAAIFLALKRRPVIRYSRTSDIAKRIAQEASEVVLSSEQDAFFKANMYENFGDIGMNIKKMVDDFQQVAKSNQNIQTIEDMAKFVDNYPEYRKMHGNVSKHVTLVTEMSRIVEERKLMLVSQTEQDLVMVGKGLPLRLISMELSFTVCFYAGCYKSVNNEHVSDIDRLRLVMLYALRYEKESPADALVQFLLKQAGVDRRTGDLYGSRDLFNYALNMARGLKGVENVYTQHQPLLSQIMESVVKGRLRDVDYPYVGNHFQQARPQDVIIFIVGGTTYEEARAVALQNSTNSGIRFILGGSAILNSKRFLKDLEREKPGQALTRFENSARRHFTSWDT
ncbi:UNVERIFIED_CONTAM: Vacuolar protein sorting-associated protein 45, partial [Sesamum calycinum]